MTPVLAQSNMLQRALVLLPSGNVTDLAVPDPYSWNDADLATGLSRTFRWGGHSAWLRPLSVAQHSLTVLAIREMTDGSLDPDHALFELLHDGEEGLLGFDCIAPLKPLLGAPFAALCERLTSAIGVRYSLPELTPAQYRLHKDADTLAAASEAAHVAGWSPEDIASVLKLSVTPLAIDPLDPGPYAPWEPWPSDYAATRWLDALDCSSAQGTTRALSARRLVTNTVSRASLESQGRAIVEGLGGKWSQNGAMCCCPAHNDSSPSLSVRVGERSLLFHCFSGCETIDVLRALRSSGHVDRSGIRTTTDVGRRETVDAGAMAKRLWDASRPITGTLAQDYLAQREISASSAELRFHPRTQLGRKPDARFFPALIAAIRDDHGVIAVHRTFLDPKTAKKAPIEDPKRLLGRPGTGAVRLSHPNEVLGLAEGVETALSAMEILGIPVWAVVGNERFGMVSIPKTVRRLILLPDPDHGGRRAAELAQNQAREGLSIEILLPPGGGGDRRGQDWNDIAMGKRGKKAAAV